MLIVSALRQRRSQAGRSWHAPNLLDQGHAGVVRPGDVPACPETGKYLHFICLRACARPGRGRRGGKCPSALRSARGTKPVAAQQLRRAGRFRRPSMTRMVAHPREYPPFCSAGRRLFMFIPAAPNGSYGAFHRRLTATGRSDVGGCRVAHPCAREASHHKGDVSRFRRTPAELRVRPISLGDHAPRWQGSTEWPLRRC